MSIKWRLIIAVLVLTGVAVEVLPNFMDVSKKWWPTKGRITYGLDIQGGVHLVMGVDVDNVMNERTIRMSRALADELTNEPIKVKATDITNMKEHEIKIVLENPAEMAKAQALIDRNHAGSLQVMSTEGANLVVRLHDLRVQEYRKQVVNQAIEVIRNRIDEFGVAEPSIVAQGDNRVLVQLPGISDSARAKDLINRTARLEFRMVSDELAHDKLQALIEETEKAGNYNLVQEGMTYAKYVKRLNDDLIGKIPKETAVVFAKLENAATIEAGRTPYLVRTDTGLGGDQLEDAFVTYDQMGKPEVTFRLSVEGRRRFAEITGNNVGKLMAIVLDEIVQSAPVIKTRIDSDRAVITVGDRDFQKATSEAQLIATALRAGALPARLEQLEERTVGPTLGADAIAKAEFAGYIAFGLIALFMILIYRGMGVIAVIALVVNVGCIIAALTGLGATLTLPGVAGIILTMGMAVDSNVIIFERIKEEFRKGSSMKLAVKEGFSNAMSAIVDSNLVGVAVALILFHYGTGPVRGFAVTLVAGIVTSMFTAVFLSKLMMDLMGERLQLKRA